MNLSLIRFLEWWERHEEEFDKNTPLREIARRAFLAGYEFPRIITVEIETTGGALSYKLTESVVESK